MSGRGCKGIIILFVAVRQVRGTTIVALGSCITECLYDAGVTSSDGSICIMPRRMNTD